MLGIVCKIDFTEDTAAHLIIEVDGNDINLLMSEMEAISALLMQYDIGEIYFADDAHQKAELWKLRRRVAEAVKLIGYTIEEDTVVPALRMLLGSKAFLISRISRRLVSSKTISI